MAVKKSKAEIATIDCNLITISVGTGEDLKEFGFDTANKIDVEPQVEEQEAQKLILKGVLRAQKPAQKTITGHKLTLTDNVFNPELVLILQGGEIVYSANVFGTGAAGLLVGLKTHDTTATLVIVQGDGALAVTNDGNDVTVSLATGGSTASDVKDAIEEDEEANALFVVSLVGEGTGTVLVASKTTILDNIVGYNPPVAGSTDKGEMFVLNAYTAQYDASGQIVQYEKTEYPNCQGVPVAFGSEDGAFRAPEYVINSAPKTGEHPYKMSYVAALPTLT